MGTRNAEKKDRNNSKRGREERLAWGLGGTVRREARKKPQHNNRGMRDRGARGAAQIKWETNVTVTKVPRCRQWKHLNREMFFCMCVCTCIFIFRFFLSAKKHSLPALPIHQLPLHPPNPEQLSLKSKGKEHSMSLWTSIIISFSFPCLSQFSNKHLRGGCPSLKSIFKILSCCDGCKRCDNWQAAAVLKLVFVVLTSFLAVSS